MFFMLQKSQKTSKTSKTLETRKRQKSTSSPYLHFTSYLDFYFVVGFSLQQRERRELKIIHKKKIIIHSLRNTLDKYLQNIISRRKYLICGEKSH